MKILLIDQDPITLEKLQISLSRLDYTVLIAADGNAGLRLAQTERPALIVMDILLPGMHGAELCRRLDQDPDTQKIPRLLITALSLPDPDGTWTFSPQIDQRFLNSHAYLPKPLDLHQFLRKVEALLKPDEPHINPTGPGVLLIIKDKFRRNEIQQALEAQNFYVRAYADPLRPLITVRYPPAILVVEDTLLNPDIWQSIGNLQAQDPALGLVVLQTEPPQNPPDYLDQIDYLVSAPITPWLVAHSVKQAIRYHNAKERSKLLSQQLFALNTDLVNIQQTLVAQNDELDQVNRRMHRLSELKETLTGMLVHDLKAPLSAMTGALQFVTIDSENIISNNTQRILGAGLAAGRQMQRLTATLLDEQKLENNQLVFDIEPIDLKEIVNIILEMMDPLFKMHKVYVETNIPADLPFLLVDPIILQRIVENLLDNAVKYSPQNESITIKAELQGEMAQICVADRGEGIPVEHRNLIFEPFIQLENAKAVEKIRSGTGLGLTFCKLAVETMRGKIWVESPDNIGSAFYFTVPVLAQDSIWNRPDTADE